MSDLMIEVEDLTKNYGLTRAVNKVSFSVKRGEVLGFLGPNGAGKSTTMKMLTCYLAPTAGRAMVAGHDVFSDSLEVRKRVGYLPEDTPIYRDMTVVEFLEFAAALRGMDRSKIAGRIKEIGLRCGLGDVAGKLVGELSKGFRQRVGLAQAMLHDPDIVILDEPTSGLDPNQIVEIRNLIREIGRNKTVILSTHILSEVQATCDRVLIIHRGEIVADGKTDDVTTHTQGGQLLRVTYAPGKVSPQRDVVLAGLGAIPGIDRVRPMQAENPRHMTFEILAGEDVRESLFRYAVDQNVIMLECAGGCPRRAVSWGNGARCCGRGRSR